MILRLICSRPIVYQICGVLPLVGLWAVTEYTGVPRGGLGGSNSHWKFGIFSNCVFAREFCSSSLNPNFSTGKRQENLFTNFTFCFSFRETAPRPPTRSFPLDTTLWLPSPRPGLAQPPFGNSLDLPQWTPSIVKPWVCLWLDIGIYHKVCDTRPNDPPISCAAAHMTKNATQQFPTVAQ